MSQCRMRRCTGKRRRAATTAGGEMATARRADARTTAQPAVVLLSVMSADRNCHIDERAWGSDWVGCIGWARARRDSFAGTAHTGVTLHMFKLAQLRLPPMEPPMIEKTSSVMTPRLMMKDGTMFLAELRQAAGERGCWHSSQLIWHPRAAKGRSMPRRRLERLSARAEARHHAGMSP